MALTALKEMPRLRPLDAEETTIRQLIERLATACRDKDIAGIMSVYSPAVVGFNLMPPLQFGGAEQYQKAWERGFTSMDRPIAYEVHDLDITVDGSLAFGRSLNWLRAEMKYGIEEMWFRWTACFRKIDGEWKIVHEHVSVPFDRETGEAMIDLKP